MDYLFRSSVYTTRSPSYNYLLFSQLHGSILPNHVRWNETPESHVFSADLPGVRRDDVRVEVEDSRYLVIRTEAAAGEEEQGELLGRNFLRKFRLPEQVDVEGISARFSEGVLKVTVPRVTATRRRRMLLRLGLEAAGLRDGGSSGSAPAA